MFVDRREVRRVSMTALVVSALAWLALLTRPELMAGHVHDMSSTGVNSLRPLGTLAPGWFLMLAAMMAPLLIAPVCHIRSRSFAARRGRSGALFVAGYFAVWTVAAAVLLTIGIAVRSLLPGSRLPASAIAVVALVWQCSPIKQIGLNRCHSHREIAAFGIAADLSAMRFGIEHGFWCTVSCWALMLLTLLVSEGHLAVMAAATILVFGDRVERPRLPSWRWRGTGGLMRIAVAQTRQAFTFL